MNENRKPYENYRVSPSSHRGQCGVSSCKSGQVFEFTYKSDVSGKEHTFEVCESHLGMYT